MKIEVLKPVEIEVYAVRINAALDEESAETVPDFLLQDGGDFEILIEIDTGRVVGWQGNVPVRIADKLSDSGTYTLLDKDMNHIARLEHEYVPNRLIPGDYGDYINLKINAEGCVENWPKQPDVSEFFEKDYE
ncbi:MULTISPECIES: hypothetical protein [unclassified Neisseria]|uniref:hypothetical protein n=1 Tax=unclassified Neisseria TaxID=2623750 RepID=UPI0010726D47|nr:MULTISPECIES: hypothetical protein [unclassified Neisseria]MBF0803326.1 hypothetical protein [Neisseria sp. 19428wB4_WF04]TFU43995.1 hypothetical protein E4T99_02985 [Neisseria sp. WF04]